MSYYKSVKEYYAKDVSGNKLDPEVINLTVETSDGGIMDVSKSLENRHYVEIMRQVEAGELTIAPADEEE